MSDSSDGESNEKSTSKKTNRDQHSQCSSAKKEDTQKDLLQDLFGADDEEEKPQKTKERAAVASAANLNSSGNPSSGSASPASGNANPASGSVSNKSADISNILKSTAKPRISTLAAAPDVLEAKRKRMMRALKAEDGVVEGACVGQEDWRRYHFLMTLVY